jgi:DNA-binding response OmpR family regulator
MKPRVVIADRDPLLLATYRAFLAAEGFDVVTARTGLECLEALRRGSLAACILDPDLPWGTGLGVLEVLREEHLPCPPVLLLTSNPALVTEAAVPVRDYAVMLKPVCPATVAGVVRTLADSFELGTRNSECGADESFAPHSCGAVGLARVGAPCP